MNEIWSRHITDIWDLFFVPVVLGPCFYFMRISEVTFWKTIYMACVLHQEVLVRDDLGKKGTQTLYSII